MPSRAELQRFFFLDDAAMELTDNPATALVRAP
jgi:hypothetical protein